MLNFLYNNQTFLNIFYNTVGLGQPSAGAEEVRVGEVLRSREELNYAFLF